MMELWINGQRVELSTDTAIGLDVAPYDIKSLPQSAITKTNTFKIPRTAANEKALEFAAVVGSRSTLLNDKLPAQIVSGYVIASGQVLVSSADDTHYYLTFFEDGKQLADGLKLLTINAVVDSHINGITHTWASYGSAITALKGETNGIIYPHQADYRNFNEVYISEELSPGLFQQKSMLYISVVTVLTKALTQLGYSLSNQITTKLFLPLFNVTLQVVYTGIIRTFSIKFSKGETTSSTFSGVSALDLLKMYVQKFNARILINEKTKTVSIYNFSSLYQTEDKTLSDKLVKFTRTFAPAGFAQTNIVTFEPDSDVDMGEFNMSFNVNNNNLEASKDFFKIDSLAPKYIFYNQLNISDFSIAPFASPKKIPLMFIDSVNVSASISVKMATDNPDPETGDTTLTTNTTLPTLKWFDASAFYTDMEAPIFDRYEEYDAELLLNVVDFKNITPFKRFFFERLGGYFIINKISGYNPDNVGTTKCQLIRIR